MGSLLFLCLSLLLCVCNAQNSPTESAGSSSLPVPHCGTSPCLQGFCSAYYALNSAGSNGTCAGVYNERYCDFCQSCIADTFPDNYTLDSINCNSSFAYFCSFVTTGSCNGLCSYTTCNYCQDIRSRCTLPDNPLPEICSGSSSPITQFCNMLRNNPICNFAAGTPYCEVCDFYETTCNNFNFTNVVFSQQICDNPLVHSSCVVIRNNPNCSLVYSEGFCQFCDIVIDRCPPITGPPALNDICNSTLRTFCQSFSVTSTHCGGGSTASECSICQSVNAMCPSIISFFDTCSHASSYACRSVINSDCKAYPDLCTICQTYLDSCANSTGAVTDFCYSEISHVCNSFPTGPSCQALVSNVSSGFTIFCSLCDLYVQDCGSMACNNSDLINMCVNNIGNLTERQVLSPQQCSPCSLVVGLCSGVQGGFRNNSDISSLGFLRSVIPNPQECRSSPCLQSFCSAMVILRYTNQPCDSVYDPEYCTFCNACENFPEGGNSTNNPICLTSMALSCAVTSRYLPCFLIYGSDYCTSCQDVLSQCPGLVFPENFFPMQVCDQPFLLSGCSVLSNNPNCVSVYGEDSCSFCNMVATKCPPLNNLPSLADLCFNATFRGFCQTLSVPLPQCSSVYSNADCSFCQVLESVCPSSVDLPTNIFDSCSQASVYLCNSVVQSSCSFIPELCTACQFYLPLCANTTANRTNFCYSEASQLCGTVPAGPSCRSLTANVSGLSTVCSLCEFYVQDCGEVACNDTNLAEMCYNSTIGFNQQVMLSAEQCSPCSLVMGLCPVLRSGVANATINSSISALRSLAPTPEECSNSACLMSLCSPITYLRHANVSCDLVYESEYCDFCESCVANSSAIDPVCTSPLASTCAITTSNFPCNSLFGDAYCNYCNGIVDQCTNLNITNTSYPTEVCNNPVIRSGCSILTSNPDCNSVYTPQACQFCSLFNTQCSSSSESLATYCSNQTLRGLCQSLVSSSVPFCGAISPTQDCALCQELELVCPSNLSMILLSLDTCSQASSYLCRSVLESDCNVLTPELCLGCQGYLQMCANTTASQEQFCFSEVSHICGSIPTGTACRSLVSSASPGLSVICSMCELYVNDCGELACNDSNLVEMCFNATMNAEQQSAFPTDQCAPCSLIIGVCPLLRSDVPNSINSSLAALQALSPTPEECRNSPCLLSICSPVSFYDYLNVPCDSVYDPVYCGFCQACQGDSSGSDGNDIVDPLCTSPIASSCAISTTYFSCPKLYGDAYCNFCSGLVSKCPNLNYTSSNGLLPAAVCDNPVLRSSCSVLTSNSNCSGLYTEQVCHLCSTFQAQCPTNGTLPTLEDLCSNATIRSACRTLVSTSLPHCTNGYPDRDCSLCQALDSICPSNFSMILSQFDTCSQASSYLCRSVLDSDCQLYTPELCMACQGYLQSCGNISGSQEQFCFSEVSQICGSLPTGQACRVLANQASTGLTVFCSLCDFYAEDCGSVICNQSSLVDSCFNTVTNATDRQTSSPQLCSPCNLVVGLCEKIRPNGGPALTFPQNVIPTAEECLNSPCLQSFCLPTTFSRQFNLPCNDTYNDDYCTFCEACYGSNNGTDPRCTSPIASSCSISARYLPCYSTFGPAYCDSCKELLNLCPNIDYPDNFFPSQVCGQPILRAACAVFASNSNCSAQYSEESCQFCIAANDMCPPVTTTPPLSELCSNDTVRDFCQGLSVSFPECAQIYTNADCSICQLFNSVCPANITTMFDTCVSESIYLCRSIVEEGCDFSSELCMACQYYLQMCPNSTGSQNQFCQSNITYVCGSIPTGVACQALSVSVPQIKIFCSVCQFYIEDCGQFACGNQDLVNFCYNSISDINSRQMLTSEQCSPCNLIVGLCPPGSLNSSLSLPDSMMPTPQECNSSPCLQSFCTPTVLTHQLNQPCENFYNPQYCSFCESCLGISGSGVNPSCTSPLATSCAINGRYLPCFTLFGNDYCTNCQTLINECPNLNLQASFFPQEVCGQPLLHSGCDPLNRTDCTSIYSREACQFCDQVATQCPSGTTFPTISDLCFNTTIRGICQALSISFPLCAQVYTNADCSLCQLINTQCPTLPQPGANCTDDYAGLFCRLIGQDTASCLTRFTPETCQTCSGVAQRCGTLEESSLTDNQRVTLCALRSACTFFPLNCGHQSEILCDYCNFLRRNQQELSCSGPQLPTTVIQQPSSTPVPSRPTSETPTPPSRTPTLPPDVNIRISDLTEEQLNNVITIQLTGITRVQFISREASFRIAVAGSLSSRRRQAVAPSSIKIVDEGVREVNGQLEVAMFADTPDGGVVSAARLTAAVRQQQNQIAQSVGASGVSGIQQGLASDLQPTSPVPQNTVGIAVGVSIGVIAVAAVVVIAVIVIAVIFYRQKRYKYSIPTHDDETRYVGYDVTRPYRSDSEMVVKKSGTVDHDTTIANVPEVVTEEEEEDEAGEKAKLYSEDITSL